MKSCLVLGCLLVLGSSGWGRAEGLTDWQAQKPPRLRLAASPYQDWLIKVLGGETDFGRHCYRERFGSLPGGKSEGVSRGHFYTRRAGFIDLAHLRRTVDFAAYVHHHVRESLQQEAPHFCFESIDRTIYHCHLRYPAFWSALRGEEREALIEEVAVRAALEAAFDFSNWREILTWYGFHNVPGFKETSSAFSFEDIPSHAVGIAVAERALRLPGVPFDEAVTRELARELAELEPVSEETYHRAMALVAGRWWTKGDCIKRHLDVGLDDGWIDPWLVPNLEPGSRPRVRRYPTPRRDVGRIAGRDCRGMVRLSCEPRPRRAEIREQVLLPGRDHIVPRQDYAILIPRVAREIRQVYGAEATRP